VEGYNASTYGDRFADVYDDWYGDVSDVEATVAGILGLVEPGAAVLELGVGTGRLALPLADRGLAVTGVDAAPEMLAQLARKPGAEQVKAVLADMAAVGDAAHDRTLAGPFALAFAAFNTFFNLTTAAAQRACLHGVAARLAPGGRVVIEAFVPPEPGTAADSVVSPKVIDADRVVLTVARRDDAAQSIVGQHIEITEQGIRMRPWQVRYAAPRELDELAAAAGFTLERRTEDWRGTPFGADSVSHVSVYRTGAR
jgi:SAM-dependent methyltransferase